MLKQYQDIVSKRRSYYKISNDSVVSDEELEKAIEFVVEHTPSAFNSQSARVVLLLNDNHHKLWDITMEALKKVVPAEKFAPTEQRINSFKAGYGTILFFEDMEVVTELENNFPVYKHNFLTWSKESSGMNQFNMWSSLRALGYGASLQHYNELIESQVKDNWDLPQNWRLVSQMPFGKIIEEPEQKESKPLETRMKIFR